MYMYGKLTLTSNGYMLDEVKSLLQKSLRRKERDIVAQCVKELLLSGRDQLTWSSLFTFLFEDHCLSHIDVLRTFYACFLCKDKIKAVGLLLSANTCRVAACLPVVSLREEYYPYFWNDGLVCDEQDSGLVYDVDCGLKFDSTLAHLKRAWRDGDVKKLITCMKLCTMVLDMENRIVTDKGKHYVAIIGNPKRVNVGHIVLACLYRATHEHYWKRYLTLCFRLICIPKSVARLALFAVVANVQFFDTVKPLPHTNGIPIDWNSIACLRIMPTWAVDRHTFRGRFGTSSKNLVEKVGHSILEDPGLVEEFHGVRPKRGMCEFFEEGCVCINESLSLNPYWEFTKEMYYSQPARQQKTTAMTQAYYQRLKSAYPCIFQICNWSWIEHDTGPPEKKSQTTASDPHGAKKNIHWKDLIGQPNAPIRGPLLQSPCSAGKTYTCVLDKERVVMKGPYPEKRLLLALFYHDTMRNVFGDVHTLKVKDKRPYLVFPLLKGKTVEELRISRRNLDDPISKRMVTDCEFVDRESLGLAKLSKLSPQELADLPYTVWLHFMYRYLLNVGDSGLYNAITDSDRSFIYGIDLEEKRGLIRGSQVLTIMFSRSPSKQACAAIVSSVLSNREKILHKLARLGKATFAEVRRVASGHRLSNPDDVVSRLECRLLVIKNTLDQLCL